MRTPSKRHDRAVLELRQRLAVGAAQVGGIERKLRLGHALEENRLAEIELVVAGREDVRRDQIGERDDVRAAVDARHQRGRQRVAAMREHHRLPSRALARSALTTAASRAKPPRRLPSAISVVAHHDRCR